MCLGWQMFTNVARHWIPTHQLRRAAIIKNIEDGEEPTFKVKYKSFKELYAKYEK